jgi:transposase
MTITQLQEQNARLRQENAALRQDLDASRVEALLLRQKLDALARRYFGKKSEQLNASQLELLMVGLEESEVEVATTKVPAKPTRRPERTGNQRVRTPLNLEVQQRIIQPQEVQAQPEQWKQIGQEVTRQLDYQPGKFFWLETVRPKYVQLAQREVAPVVAPAPERASGLAAPGLLAWLLVCKFADALPFYRQEAIFRERHGIFITRQQMVQWMKQGTFLLEGIYRCIQAQLQASRYVQLDETPVDYLDPGKGRCSQGYLWTGHVPGECVVFQWHASRAAKCLDLFLGPQFRGKIQCDGYSAYPAFARDKEGIQLFGCWAHARRGLFEAQEQAPRMAGWLLHQLSLLFGWEAQAREEGLGPKARQAIRASHHRMVLERLHRVLLKLRGRYLPQSKMGGAITYLVNQWATLSRIVDHGEVEWTNNLVENIIRPTAIGKKNFLFFGAEDAGQRNAIVYTLIANCRLHGVEPYEYLKDVLSRLPSATNHQLADLTPKNWQAPRQKTVPHRT